MDKQFNGHDNINAIKRNFQETAKCESQTPTHQKSEQVFVNTNASCVDIKYY